MPSLFDPISLGDIRAANRIIMAPLTRSRATAEHVPTDIMAEHYRQRASAGLIIGEGVGVSRSGLGWPCAPGLWTRDQIEAWKPITAAVRGAGGAIVAQIWHMGRMARPTVTGSQPVSASATRAPYATEPNPYVEARAASHDDIAQMVDEFGHAARAAMEAGFDGVQVQAGNGYVIDQFLRNGTNFREDEYGGAPANRLRFLQEVMERCCGEIGAGRVGVRLSPNGDSQGCDDSDPEALFGAVATMLDNLGIGFIELRELLPNGTFGASDVPKLSPLIREKFAGALILNQDYSFAAGQADLDKGVADAISWGRLFIGNPDLVERFRHGEALNQDDPTTWYTPGVEGYNDYPVLPTRQQAAKAA
jgi:N-ethylmaleimide reductase